ncbi:MAG: hypothetical protein HY863_15625 [Chloroflexi bacterium]|nr:hypothetical protein [Chloroflexota bacterium]
MAKTKRNNNGLVSGVTVWLEGALALSQAFERLLVDVVAAFVPWLAPVIPAYLAFHSLYYVLIKDVLWVSIVGAAVVEFLGLATVTTVVQFNDFNETRKEEDPNAPLWPAALTAGFYLIVVLTVNVLLDTAEPIQKFAKLLLSSLSVAGAITISLRGQHRRRVEAKAARDMKLDAERKIKEKEETAYKHQVAEERRNNKQELKRLELQAKVSEKKNDDLKVSAQVTESISDSPATFGKWKRWPAVPDEYKRHIALEIAKNKEVNAANYKKLSAGYLVREFGLDERGAYNWIGYAERDFGWLVEVNHDAVVVTDEFQPLKTEA